MASQGDNVFEDFLQSEILLHCVKKCLARPEISRSQKLKILFLMYEKNKYSESMDEHSSNLNGSLSNLLGIDNDLIQTPSELLTADESKELKKLILGEMRKFHSFCLSLRRGIKQPPDTANYNELFEPLISNLKNQISGLNECLGAQNKIEHMKSEAYSSLLEMSKIVISTSKKNICNEWKLYEEIIKTMTSGSLGQSLQVAERVLEAKVNSNIEKIEQMKLTLLEYYNKQ